MGFAASQDAQLTPAVKRLTAAFAREDANREVFETLGGLPVLVKWLMECQGGAELRAALNGAMKVPSFFCLLLSFCRSACFSHSVFCRCFCYVLGSICFRLSLT